MPSLNGFVQEALLSSSGRRVPYAKMPTGGAVVVPALLALRPLPAFEIGAKVAEAAAFNAPLLPALATAPLDAVRFGTADADELPC
mmetsp:Transcript_15846/g.37374  ORF Transcript_15846/g.37374 Transcript_15846/m.37374 type:complete len:86 (+) Transcript_15846:628-885(+)